MTFKPGQSGNPKGRPPVVPEMTVALRMTAARLEEILPNAQLSAHQLLRAIYCDDAFPLLLRFRAAEAALPYEKPRLSATAQLDTGNESLAARLRAAQQRVGVRAADILAMRETSDPGDAPSALSDGVDLLADALTPKDGGGGIVTIEGCAETIAEQPIRVEDFI